MRVLHVAHGWPPRDLGGTELYAAALCDAQAVAGAETSHWSGEGVPTRRLLFPETFTRPETDAAFDVACGRFRPDVVHVHHLTGLSMGIPALARVHGARVVMTLHDAWLACARGQLVDVDGGRCAGPEPGRCARCLAPALWAPVPARIARRLPVRTAAVMARFEALSALREAVDLFLCPSRHLPARVGIDAEYVPLPLLAAVPPAPPVGPGPLRILFLGGLLPTKGPRFALDAFARLPAGAASLRLVGPAPRSGPTTAYVAALRARASQVPGARIEEPVPHAAVPALLGEADVLVFPSTWEENSPLVLREAAAAGLRIVASDVPGVAEVAPNAVRVEPGSVDALRRALAAEVRRGRARNPPRPSTTMEVHAAWMLDRYARLRAAV